MVVTDPFPGLVLSKADELCCEPSSGLVTGSHFTPEESGRGAQSCCEVLYRDGSGSDAETASTDS